ncbi:MAG: hypothetical protein VX278_02165 [Myxococcota bacterium]|nr:hypothetical protein [Myxococcota bacterium]
MLFSILISLAFSQEPPPPSSPDDTEDTPTDQPSGEGSDDTPSETKDNEETDTQDSEVEDAESTSPTDEQPNPPSVKPNAPKKSIEYEDLDDPPPTKAPPKKKKKQKERIVTVDKPVQTVFPMLYSGLERADALRRVSAASKIDTASLGPITFDEIIIGQAPSSPSNVEIENCRSTPVSKDRLRMLSQQIQNEIVYYELEKAQKHLKDAQEGILCINTSLDFQTAARIYYLAGVLEQILGNEPASIANFYEALTLRPNLQWDANFPPDALPFFQKAQKRVAQVSEVPLNIVPKEAKTSVWINGVPLTAEENALLFSGVNTIQIIGNKIYTQKIRVPADTPEVVLVIPSSLSNASTSWMHKPEKQKEVAIILTRLMEESTNVYLHDQGKVWTTVIGQSNWAELNVPRGAMNASIFSKKQIGRGLMWGGAGMTAIFGGITANKYLRAREAANSAQDTDYFQVFDESRTNYTEISKDYQYWVGATVLSLVTSGVGFYMTF